MTASEEPQIQTPAEVFENDPQVKRRVRGVSSKRSAFRNLLNWYLWLQENDQNLRGLSPSDLIAYSNKKEIELSLEDWINDLLDQGLRLSTLLSYYARVRGFFRDALEPLPASPDFTRKIQSRIKTEKVENNLNPNFIRRVLDTMRQAPRTAVLCMFQTAMDRKRFTDWNKTGYLDLKAQLDSGENLIKIQFSGRKRNRKPYYSFLGKDSIESLKLYFRGDRIRDRVKSTDSNEYIFYSIRGSPLSGDQVADIWTNAVKKFIETDKNPSYSTRYGIGVHNLRDVFSTTLHKVDNLKSWAIEFFMGHSVDPLGYNEAFKDLGFMKTQYRLAEPYLNILSNETEPFSYIKKEEAQGLMSSVSSLETQNQILQGQISQLQSQLKAQEEAQNMMADARVSSVAKGVADTYNDVIDSLQERIEKLESQK